MVSVMHMCASGTRSVEVKGPDVPLHPVPPPGSPECGGASTPLEHIALWDPLQRNQWCRCSPLTDVLTPDQQEMQQQSATQSITPGPPYTCITDCNNH